MKYLLIACLAGLALAAPAHAQAPGGKAAGQGGGRGDPVAGKLKSEEERCQECHGHDGNANDIEDGVGNIGKFPKLAGQFPAYIAKQIRDFRSGARNHEFMAIMARSVGDADVADIAAYFAGQKRMPGEGGDNPRGRALFSLGDPARGIPACAACHGEAGKGTVAGGVVNPVIGGQHRRYLHKQLVEWRAGERRNSPGGVMNGVAKALGDADIDALAAYISGL